MPAPKHLLLKEIAQRLSSLLEVDLTRCLQALYDEDIQVALCEMTSSKAQADLDVDFDADDPEEEDVGFLSDDDFAGYEVMDEDEEGEFSEEEAEEVDDDDWDD